MFITNTPVDVLGSRIDAGFHDPETIGYLRLMRTNGFALRTLANVSSRMNSGPFGSSLHASDYVNRDVGVVFFRPVDCKGMIANASNSNVYISRDDNQRLSSSSFRSGSVLITKIGNGIGDLAVVPNSVAVCNISGNMMGLTLSSYDPYFVAAYFHGRFGTSQIKRAIIGGPMPKIDMATIGDFMLPDVALIAQQYIGDKVRQAERLRHLADNLQSEIDQILRLRPLQQAMATPYDHTNRVSSRQLEPRLDAKFYSPRAMRVFEAAIACDGVPIADLKPVVSNGFEYRTFVERGKPLATVSQVSSKRLDLTGAPQIPETTPVPNRARLSPKTILAVRSGATIGTVVKIHQEDCIACACGDFVVFHFPDESLAAAVAAFLNSEPGRILQDKVIYGGVIPKICQDDLLTLPIPKALLEASEKVASWMNAREQALRCSQRLVTSAKLLVESLIEGRLAESDLVKTQHALQGGDRSLDRAILSRLTENGIDVADKPPLFPDLDALFTAIDEAQRTQPSNGDDL